MRLVDTNAYLGHWAARRLRYNTPEGLLQLMDRAGIAQAWVSSASAIMYRNCHAGNEELHEALTVGAHGSAPAAPPVGAHGSAPAAPPVGAHGSAPETPEGALPCAPTGRLVPFTVLSPAYAGWERDLVWCHEVMGAKGLRLYPDYHRYRLGDACCHALVEAATELGMVISVPQRMEDYRQRHWLIDAPDVNLGELASLIGAHPRAKFVVSNALGVHGSDLVLKRDDLPANYWVDICRPDVVYGKEALALIDALGPDRIVFGSGIPFNYPEPAIVRMEVLESLGYDVAAIGAGNAEGLLA